MAEERQRGVYEYNVIVVDINNKIFVYFCTMKNAAELLSKAEDNIAMARVYCFLANEYKRLYN